MEMGSGAEETSAVKKSLVHIPSHAQVLENARPQPPLNMFRASSIQSGSEPGISISSQQRATYQSERVAVTEPSSFTEAFSFLRNTEFYTPPPPPPAPPSGVNFGGGVASKYEVPPPALTGQARNAILVSRRQQGNPVLKFIRNVRWVYGDVVPDYILGQTTCALYLSLRYHLLHPDYLYFRIRELQRSFRLRVVLCHVDVEDVIKPLHEVTKIALLHDCSLLCAWSLEECGRYLETLKMYENKPADNIQERTDNDYLSRLTSAITTVRHVNRTDVVTLGSSFGTLAAIIGASMEELARCPGIGERKVKRLYDAFHEPFRRTTKQLRLSNVGIRAVQEENDDAEISISSEQGGANGGETVVANGGQAVESRVSVRKALDVAYAKVVDRQLGRRDDTDKERTSVDKTKTPAPNVEVIDLT